MKNLGLRSSLIPAAFLILTDAQANVMYVDPKIPNDCNGNYHIGARNCSGRNGTAYKNIQKAVSAARSGDRIFVRGGTYKESIKFDAKNRGTALNPITFSNFESETVILDGSNGSTKNRTLIVIDKSQHIKIKGIKVTKAGNYGIKVANSQYVDLEKVEVSYCQWGGIVFEGGSHHTVRSSIVHHTNLSFNGSGGSSSHEAITMDGVDTFEISNSEVYENWKEGIDAKYGARNGSIHHNRVHHNNYVNVYVDAANNIDIHNNIIHNAGNATSYRRRLEKQGIALGVEDDWNKERHNLHSIRVYNNIIYNNNSSGLMFWVHDKARIWAKIRNIKIFNNTFHNNAIGGVFVLKGNQSNYENGNEIKNNIFWNNRDHRNYRKEIRDQVGVINKFQITHNLFNSNSKSDTFGKFPVMTSNVKFIDLSKANYRLAKDSPAVDAGTPATAAANTALTVVKRDFFDYPRPVNGYYDIGAYEYRTSTSRVAGLNEGTGSEPENPSVQDSDSTLPLEVGEVNVNHHWTWVSFGEPFVDPVIVAKPPSYNGTEAAVIRIRHVSSTGFEIGLQEWDYQDGYHATEVVSYLVMERGNYTLADGTQIEAGQFEANNASSFERINWSDSFQTVPVVLLSVATFNEADAVTTRIRNVSVEGFEFRLQEQERNDPVHASETLGYIAWEPSAGMLADLRFKVARIGNVVGNQFYTITHELPDIDVGELQEPPSFLADIQTSNEENAVNLRWTGKDFATISVKIEEETSNDEETAYEPESVGYILLGM